MLKQQKALSKDSSPELRRRKQEGSLSNKELKLKQSFVMMMQTGKYWVSDYLSPF